VSRDVIIIRVPWRHPHSWLVTSSSFILLLVMTSSSSVICDIIIIYLTLVTWRHTHSWVVTSSSFILLLSRDVILIREPWHQRLCHWISLRFLLPTPALLGSIGVLFSLLLILLLRIGNLGWWSLGETPCLSVSSNCSKVTLKVALFLQEITIITV
jgi:hypothetical protein